ncbi:hypothetical protein IFR09_04700 [Pseudomonas syringae]|nr:hypothetical protein [Pseudomonas syringae]MBD8574197.1 hypothetical protein [Pseudomonas syringae]MBD8791694.1 hypothetical protein [Pseudomonas syringae]MBD8801054.1 hypothetical protein [Pseudomonas syringae]MBD8810458.1 hypothetical protein [Pseudomonas syringae]
MKQWAVSYVDKDGVTQSLNVDSQQLPTSEEAAQLLRHKLFPVTDELNLNDLDGRMAEPTLKTLKDHNSVEILSIKELPQRSD